MRTIFTAAAVLAALITPAAATAQTVDLLAPAPRPGFPVTIRVVNSSSCFASRIDAMRATENDRMARKESVRLRKLGFKPTIVTSGPGLERTMPGDAVRVFTAAC